MDATVEFLLAKIDALLNAEIGLPKKVESGIITLKSELEVITAFLRQTHQRGDQDDQILVWVRQVQDAAYDIRHVLDLFSYYQTKNGARGRITKLKAKHSIEDKINDLNSRLKEINETKQRYQRANSSLTGSSRPSLTRTNHSDLHPRIASLYLADADVVGFEEDKGVLMAHVLDMEAEHKVIFVVGMGGSGKTTLTKQVFEAVKTDFDCCALFSVSKSRKTFDILWNMFDTLCNSSAGAAPSSLDSRDLINKINNYLQDKRYVIVLDDLWILDVWESVKLAFPISKSSRIIITTRDIANSRKDRSIYVHNIQPLSLENAKKIFHRNAFPRNQTCPPALDGFSNDILRKCEGLPLAIIEIGKLLLNKEESGSEWKNLHDNLGSELRGNGGRLSNITRVLILSYNDLPYHLKNCFLLMNTFPPNHPIQRRKLIRLWIVEGFVKEGNNIGKELEDVGEEYLNELQQRNLIQVCEMDFDGRPRSYRIHNIIHQIVLSEVHNEKFCEVFPGQGTIVINNESIRRISIHKGNLGSLCKKQRALALLIFDSLSPYEHSTPISYSSLKMLRILHLEGANLDVFPEEIKELLLLSYLCLRNTRIKSIPKFIKKLRYLETLDLKQTRVSTLPKEICRLNKLRDLLVYQYDIEHYLAFNSVEGFEVEAGGIKGLVNLRKVSCVQVHKDNTVIHAMQGLSKLRKLGIIGLLKKDGRIFCETLEKLTNLYSLNVRAENEKEILDIQEISHPPPLRRLYLNGRLEKMPPWISRLHDLVRLRLRWSRLGQQSNNPINFLQDLPNLLELQLLDAYNGNQLDFNAGKFCKLKILEFELLENLKMVIMETNTLPSLQKLIIRRCSELRQIPVGIENLSHLKEIELYDMPKHFVSVLEKNVRSLYHHVPHIPLIRSYVAQNGGHWVVKDLS